LLTSLNLAGCIMFVMNNTSIDMRTLCPNIYMYRRGRIYKEPPLPVEIQ
jgi:hypothetical protein